MTMEYLISDLSSSIPILQKISDGQKLSFDEAWSLVTLYKKYKEVDNSIDMPEARYSKEELIAKYFSREIEVALTCRLSRLKGARLTTEVKNIENTMFFRLPSILRIPCSLNIPAGSTCGENPNVRHRSREELLRELVDQGYNVNQYKL